MPAEGGLAVLSRVGLVEQLDGHAHRLAVDLADEGQRRDEPGAVVQSPVEGGDGERVALAKKVRELNWRQKLASPSAARSMSGLRERRARSIRSHLPG